MRRIQPKYDYLDEQLSLIPKKTIREVVDIRKSIEPSSETYQEEELPFVQMTNLSKFGLEDPNIRLDRSSP